MTHPLPRRDFLGRFNGRTLTSGTAFDIGRLHFTALPANHLLPDPSEQALKTTNIVDDKTVCVLDHMARTLWPADLKQAEKLATDRGWILAADGMEFELRRAPAT